MEITIKTNNGMELAGMFAGLLGGGQISAPAFSLPKDEESMMKEDEKMEEQARMQEEQGERVRELRQRKGLTQERFCEVYGIPKRTLENWEQGSRKPPEYVVALLERAVEQDEKIKAMKKKHDQDLLDVATGKKKVRVRGQADV